MNSITQDRRKVVRIAVLNSHPIQYFAPLYAYLNCPTAGIEVTALYLSDFSIRGARDVDFGREVKWDLDLLAGYHSVFLGAHARARVPAGFWSMVAPQVWNELRSGRYDVLWLHGHNYAANLLALAAAKAGGMHVMMRCETHLGLPRKGIKAILRRPLMGALYGLCDRLLAIGSKNADFYRSMGVPDKKIFTVPYAVDNERFIKAANLTAIQIAEVRRRYRIAEDAVTILYAAKFTARKRPLDLLRVAESLRRKTRQPFTVVMVGSGELESELRAYCAKYHLDDVVFPGFVNQTDLPLLYGASDIFVLPSEHEPWGLAVNEAMCAALPVIAAREIGCVADLVDDGVNGYTFRAGDTDALASALLSLIDDQALRARLGRASLARISHWGYRECLEGIRLALSGLEHVMRPTETLPMQSRSNV